MAVEIQLLKDDQAALANNFFNDIYKTNRSFEHFRWEFFEGPKGKAVYVIAVDTSETKFVKIVGIQCAIPIELVDANGKTILTAKSEDTLVHPDYRGQKLFERMYALLFDACTKAGIKYIWGFTPAVKAFERIGFEVPFQAQQAIMVLNPFKAYNHLVQLNPLNTPKEKIKIALLCGLSFLKGFKRFFVSGDSTGKVIVPASKNSVVSSFYRGTPFYFLHQDDAYLTWRVKNNPFKNTYKNLQFGETNAPVADIIINQRAHVSYIEQQLYATQPEGRKLAALKTSVSHLTKTNTGLIRTLCFENNDAMVEHGKLLQKIGFVYLKRGNSFVWKSLDESQAISSRNIFFSRLFTQGNL